MIKTEGLYVKTMNTWNIFNQLRKSMNLENGRKRTKNVSILGHVFS